MGIKDNILFVREHNPEPYSAEDIWDDTLLIKAYERAVNLAKQKLAKKGSAETENAGMESDHSPVKASKKANTRNNNIHWKEGSFCRAIYSEDGEEYEAIVIRVIPWKGKCVVRYLGYGNEEEVEIGSLRPSRGERVREIQQTESGKENEMADDVIGKEQESLNALNDTKKSAFPSMIPPPPPLSLMANFPANEGEAFSSMLMSWYMSGYHTGYYQGMLRNKMGNHWSNSSDGYSHSHDEMNQTQI